MENKNERSLDQVAQEINELYEIFYREEEEDVRRSHRNKWRELTTEYEKLAGYNPYRTTL